uniref:Nudix hydrolase domain-containing protein n=1 Tax=Physcomitrium patens TaxID=3218 RepID=A0A7I4E687_PHYPA|nr:uncharacterized protein LOC112284517 isoform X2 [Physcomitrium patens]|eukprot:XP_024380159.1 uncharacterized protein LOC112284517 isoform X2 [Physcomitrella patens]
MVLRLYVQECVTVDLFKSICTFMTTYPSTPSESSEEVFKFNLNSRVHLSVLTLSSTLAGGLNGAILAIQEKHGIWSQGEWKRPTGVIKQGEDIFAGIEREVLEETGIDPEFVQVIGFSASVCYDKLTEEGLGEVPTCSQISSSCVCCGHSHLKSPRKRQN